VSEAVYCRDPDSCLTFSAVVRTRAKGNFYLRAYDNLQTPMLDSFGALANVGKCWMEKFA